MKGRRQGSIPGANRNALPGETGRAFDVGVGVRQGLTASQYS